MERQETFTVSGMHCEACVKRIDKAVRAVSGVAGVEVDLSCGEVHVSFDEDRVGIEDIAQSIADLGYEVALADDEEEHLH